MTRHTVSSTCQFSPENNQRLASLCGPCDENLRQLENHFTVDISMQGNTFCIRGRDQAVSQAEDALKQLYKHTKSDKVLTPEQVYDLLRQQKDNHKADHNIQVNQAKVTQNMAKSNVKKLKPAANSSRQTQAKIKKTGVSTNTGSDSTTITTRKAQVKPRTLHQRQYIENIHNHDINFGIGPAGTGKTFLAVACALEALERGDVTRLIIVRPAVEAGEKLGFLPGDLAEKVLPYLRPIYDAIYYMLGVEEADKLIEKDVIEIAPLAYMRGRTLSDAFIILDEAQNTTIPQMKMFLTRIGFGSTAVITGDATQVDLPQHQSSGLAHAVNLMQDIDAISINYFNAADTVRHPIVQAIIEAYEKDEEG